jgi:cell division protein FtsI/penicillin-binding protein 2
VLIQTDARRQAFSRVERLPTAGDTLELTIDQYLQHIAERELRAGVEWAEAPAGR